MIYYDQRGHGRSDYSSHEFWNLRTWADDLRRLLILAGEDDPVCPEAVVRELARQLPAATTRLVSLPQAHHTTV